MCRSSLPTLGGPRRVLAPRARRAAVPAAFNNKRGVEIGTHRHFQSVLMVNTVRNIQSIKQQPAHYSKAR